MDIDNLIRMVNRIDDFFAALPNDDEAAEGIVNHIQKFWEPRMRWALLDFLTAHPDGRAQNAQLHPLALRAISAKREQLTPASRLA